MIDEDTNAGTGSETGGSTRQRAIEAYETARDSVAGAGRRAASGFAEAPLIALAGGLAAGALIAALLPRTEGETRLIRPTARRVKDTANAAFKAARDTGKDRFEELGFTREQGQEQVRNFLRGLKDTAKASGQAAVDAARNKG